MKQNLRETSLAGLKTRVCGFVLVAFCLTIFLRFGNCAEGGDVELPGEAKAVWDIEKAFRENSTTRERVSLNGLWRWQPAEAKSETIPAENWGFFKVPGCWPGITSYIQKDSQTVFAHATWKTIRIDQINAAWYQRTFEVPAEWQGRQVLLDCRYLNSFAAVYVNGNRVGEIRFPGGEVDLSKSCTPGSSNTLSLLVVAMPLQGVRLSYTDSASAKEVKGTVPMRGLCGDVSLVGRPPGPCISNVRTFTSTRNKQCTFDTALVNLEEQHAYSLKVRVMADRVAIKEFNSPAFSTKDLTDNHFSFRADWLPDRLWDTHTPQNTFQFDVSLLDSAGKALDQSWKERLGFREFWIQGRDFYLNGTRVFLSAVPLDNAQVSAGLASYDAAKESLLRLKSFGINFVYSHNYDCEPGSHLSFDEVLRAADDVGMLVALSQPHFSHYDWRSAKAEEANGYAQHADCYVRVAQNHPSVVAYAMSHNATAYNSDMDPDLIDGIHAPRDNWSLNNSKLALRAEAIVRRLDPSRVVYHHASGNLGSMHTINFYPNFVPIQELSDWFEHWSTQGVKPVFMCEYGAPFTWDWTMYRGWYKGKREFGSATAPWEFCMAEWNSQFFGDEAFRISEAEKANLRWEAAQFRAGKLWHRWDYPNQVGSIRFDEQYPVMARYLTDNWRAFRTWEVSAISPWDYSPYWKPRNGVDRRRRNLKVDWDQLQRPGYSADFIDGRCERMDLAFEKEDWVGTPASEALLRNNAPVLAYLAGKPASLTSKDHVFLPGQSIEKQLIVINNSRVEISGDCEWSFDVQKGFAGREQVRVPTGTQERIPLKFVLPDETPAGRYQLKASVRFKNDTVQQDSFAITVLRPQNLRPAPSKVALYDLKGETTRNFQALGIQYSPVDAKTDLTPYDVLIVGKSALTVNGAAPDITRVREGLKVLIFEQTSQVLEKRFGFRVVEYGLRQAFIRIVKHPVLQGLDEDSLRDWRGEATLTPSRLTPEMRPKEGPTVQWCGIPVTRIWRCGNRGNVASVLIEKPTRGDFLPVIDGGFSLQFTPLVEHREGKGLVVFCQMDVTGRSETEPASEILERNLLQYVANWTPSPRREAVYSGDEKGKAYLDLIGIKPRSFDGGKLSASELLIAAPGSEPTAETSSIRDWIKNGGNTVVIGMDENDARALLPFKVQFRKQEHLATYFKAFDITSPIAGISSADVHCREPQNIPLVSQGAEVVGDGVLAKSPGGNVVFCQLEPWIFEGTSQLNLRRTQRRTSFLLSRLLANMGVASATPLLERFNKPVESKAETRWLTGFYGDRPEEWDDPVQIFPLVRIDATGGATGVTVFHLPATNLTHVRNSWMRRSERTDYGVIIAPVV